VGASQPGVGPKTVVEGINVSKNSDLGFIVSGIGVKVNQFTFEATEGMLSY